MAIISLLNNQDNFLSNEHDVLADLIDENLQATGSDVRYMPKDQLNLDTIFNESTVSDFKSGFIIEMYLAHVNNFNGDNDLFSKFGMEHTDDATLIVSMRRFLQEGQLFGLKKPIEGDIIYMPWSNTLWNIRKVKEDPDYFQFGQNRVWRIECNLYTPSHDDFKDALSPESLGQTSEVDESGMEFLLGISPETKQDQSDVFALETESTTIPNEFNSDNPFGE